MFTTAVFDLDGTLVETTDSYILDVVGQSLDRLGKTATNEQKRDIWFLYNSGIYDELGVDIHEYWAIHRTIDLPEIRVRNTRCCGDIAAIAELKRAGIGMSIVTGARPSVAEAQYALVKEAVGDCFHQLICAHPMNNMPAKPDPASVLLAIKNLGAQAESSCYIGDTSIDTQTARNAKILDILVDRENLYLDNKHRIQSLDALPVMYRERRFPKDGS
jgi:phosphoglycolate phosphatase